MKFFKSKVTQNYTYILDFYEDYIKIIGVNKNNRKTIIDKIFSINIKEFSEIKIKDFFKRLLPQEKEFDLITFVSRKDVTIKNLSLPSISKDEIRKMVKFQIEEKIPYPIDEISFDYKIQSIDNLHSNIIVAIAHKRKISSIVTDFGNYNLDLDSIVLDVDALYNWVNFVYGELKGSVAIVDIDGYNTRLLVVKDNKMDFSRSISSGYIDLCEDKSVKKIIIEEIVRSLSVYQKKKLGKIDRLIITGAENGFKYLDENLKEQLRCSVETKSSFDKIPLGFASKKSKKQGSGILSFSYLIGAGLFSKQEKLDFLPKRIKAKKQLKHKEEIIKKIGIGVIVFFVTTIIAIFVNFYLSKRQLDLLNNKIKQINPSIEKIKEEVMLIKELSNYLENRKFSLNILDEVYKSTPPTISLTYLELNRGNTLVIRGETEKISDVLSFVGTLEKSSYFNKIDADSVDVDDKTGIEVVNFELYCNLAK